MIRVTVEIRERTTSRRVSVTAPSIAQALGLAGDGRPGKTVRVLFPIPPEEFFVKDGTQPVAAWAAEQTALRAA
jgi:hypothetical protein